MQTLEEQLATEHAKAQDLESQASRLEAELRAASESATHFEAKEKELAERYKEQACSKP